MKSVLTITLVSLVSVVGSAQILIPGAILDHNLNCEIPKAPNGDHLLGVGYSMTCDTQALAPQLSLRGCTLYSLVLYPNAQPKEIKLDMIEQTFDEAQLENKAASIKVVLDKVDLSAVVSLGGNAIMKCVSSN